MGVRIRGMRELIHDLETLPERAEKELPRVVSRGALQIKIDWRTRWGAIKHQPSAIPHLVSGIGYDTDKRPPIWAARVGVAEHNSQSPLAHLVEYGSLNSSPHPAGQDSLDAEDPRFVRAVGDVAVDLLDGP